MQCTIISNHLAQMLQEAIEATSKHDLTGAHNSNSNSLQLRLRQRRLGSSSSSSGNSSSNRKPAWHMQLSEGRTEAVKLLKKTHGDAKLAL